MNRTQQPRKMDDYIDNTEAYADGLDLAERDEFLKSPVWAAHCKFTSSPMVDSGIDWASLIRTAMKARGIATSGLVEMVRGRISKQTIYNLLNSRIVNAHVLGTVITAVGMVVRLEPNPLKPLKASAPVKPAKAGDPNGVALPAKPGRQYRKAWRP